MKLIFLLISLFILSFPSLAFAAGFQAPGIATYVLINDNNVQDGDIITATSKGYSLSKTLYDPSLFGVINNNPAAAFVGSSKTGEKAVISSGKAYVRVTTANGKIKKKNFITSSTKP